MKRFVKRSAALLAGMSLMCSTSLAHAAAPVAPVANSSAWSALAFLNGGQSAAAYCGASAVAAAGAVAAQGTSCVLPQLDPMAAPSAEVMGPQVPPPLPGAAVGVSGGGGLGISPLVLALGALAAAAAIYFLVNGLGNDDDDDNSPA
jgi:hypothetical protein